MISNDHDSTKPKREVRKSRWITATVVSAALVIFVTLAHVTLINWYLQKNLTEIVEKKFNRNGKTITDFHFDSLRVDIWDQRIFTKDISFHLESKNEIIAEAPLLTINVGSFIRFWWKDEVAIEQFILNKPHIQVIEKKHLKDTLSLDQRRTKSINKLMEHLDLVNLTDIHIRNATVLFHEKDSVSNQKTLLFQLNKLSIDLEQLIVEKSIFLDITTKKLTVRLEDQAYTLPDSSFTFQVKRMDYHHQEKALQLEGLKITSTEDHQQIVHVPWIEIKDIILKDGHLSVDSLSLESPLLALNPSLFSKKGQKKINRKKTEIPFIKFVEVDHFHILNSRLNGSVSDHITLDIEEWEVMATHLKWQVESKLTTLELSDMEVGLRDLSIHHIEEKDSAVIKIFEAKYNYDDKDLTLDSVDITINSPYQLLSHVKGVKFFDLDMNELIDNKFRVKELHLIEPLLNVTVQNPVGSRTEKKNRKPIFDSWYAEKVRVDRLNATLDQSPHQLKFIDADIHFWEVDLDDGEWQAADFLENFSCHLPDVAYQNKYEKQKMSLFDNYYTSFDSTLLIRSGRFSNPSTDFSWKNLQIKNQMDLDHLGDSLFLAYVSLDTYRFEHQLAASDINKNLLPHALFIDSLAIGSGDLKVKDEKEFFLHSSPQRLEIDGLVYADDLWQANDLQFAIHDINAETQKMKTSLKSLIFESERHNIKLSDISILNKDTVKQKTKASIDSITLTMGELYPLLNERETVDIKEIQITDPKIMMETASLIDEESSSFDMRSIWPENAPTVNIENMSISNGALRIFTQEHKINSSGIGFHLSGIELTNDSIVFHNQPSGLLYAKTYDGMISHLDFQTVLDTVSIQNLKLGEVIETYEFSHQSSNIDRTVAFDHLYIRGFQPNRLLLERRLALKDIFIDHPHIKLSSNPSYSKDERIIPFALAIDSIAIVNGDLDIEWGDDDQSLQLSPLNLSLGKVSYDPELNTFQWPAETYNLSTGALSFRSRNELMRIQLDDISFNQYALEVKNLLLKPQYEKEEYFEKLGYETDWIYASIPSIRLEALDKKLLLKDSIINAPRLIIENPVLNSFRDKHFPEPHPSYKKLPVSALKTIPFPIRIDTIEIRNAHITHQLKPEKGSRPGKIMFSDLNAMLSNVTNNPEPNEMTDVHVRTNAMEKVPVQVMFHFDLNSEYDEFSLTGSVAPHKLETFNEFTEYGTFVQVQSGNTKSLHFSIQANDTVGYGTMYFAYNDFKIAMMDRENYTTNNVDESVISFIANTFLFRKRNQSLTRFRKGDIYFERIQHKGIFNYLVKLFVSGVASSIGFRNNEKEVAQVKQE